MKTTAGLLLLALVGAGDPAPRDGCSTELFRIARNKNANVVVYEANWAAPGILDPRDPVRASWLMLAEKGQREDLNFLERAFAYGFEVRPASPLPGFWLALKADPKRQIYVSERESCPQPFTPISGRMGVLKVVYIEAEAAGLIPPVRSIQLFGTDPETGEELSEKILVSR